MALTETVPTLILFTETGIAVTASAPTGGSGTVRGQWYRSAIPGDSPTTSGGSAVALAGQTGTTCVDAPSRPPASQGEVWYYFRVSTDDVGTARSPKDIASPMADWPRKSIVFSGTSLVAIDGATSIYCPPAVCARAISRMNGFRWVDWLNCGQGGSNSADWLPTALASTGTNLGGSQSYYNWMTQSQIPAFVSSIGKGVDYFFMMHETNDHPFTPQQYRDNMQATIDALHALHPAAKFLVSYAPFEHNANTPGANPAFGNPQLATKHVATDALIAANPGLVFSGGKRLFAFTAFHPELADYTTPTQPAYSIHYQRAGMAEIGDSWAQDGFRPLLFPQSFSRTRR